MRALLITSLLLGQLSSFGQGNSLLWKITGNGLTKPSYLYGTMHTRDARVFHFADQVWPAFESCDAFAMELLVDETMSAQIMQSMYMDSSETLQNLVSGAQYDSLDAFSRSHVGVSISAFDRMKPIYTSVLLSDVNADKNSGATENDFLDLFFQHHAQLQNKNVTGLETLQEQLNVFNVLDYKDQAKLLLQSLRSDVNDSAVFEKMMGYYMNNDLFHLMQFENDFQLPDSLFDALFTLRNERMAVRIDSLIQQHSVFVAIGAGHLGNEKGVVELLRQRGYTVVPVIPEYHNYLSDGWYHFTSVSFSSDFPSLPLTLVKDNHASVIHSLNGPGNKSANFFVADVPSGPASAVAKEIFASLLPDQKIVSAKNDDSSWKGMPASRLSVQLDDGTTASLIMINRGDHQLVIGCSDPKKIDRKSQDRFFNSIELFV